MGPITHRRQFAISGHVQGVGFRPFLWRLATRYGLGGWVANVPEGVRLEVQGSPAAIEAFRQSITTEAPPLARIEQVLEQPTSPQPASAAGANRPLFVIRPSHTGGVAATGVLPDIAPCPACLEELNDPTNRRFRYPFINCTDCGPRFTIITALPYDRPQTTMARFAMCADCRREYEDPADRRFHAQPIACPRCGPVVWYTAGVAVSRPSSGLLGELAIVAARRHLRDGQILAVKGIGGFHLVCDATNNDAVARLRRRKHRPAKPLAVMTHDLAAAAQLAEVDDQAARMLADPSRPIVLLPTRQPSTPRLAVEVAPGNGFLGVMLPSSPLHVLLTAGDDDEMPPLVVTSGNLAEEPIIHDNATAATRLGALADGFLMHDRPIHVPCDDSVVRSVAGMPLPIRLARGHAPQTLQLADDGPCVLAVGGELKATLCLALGRQALLSQHLGDVSSPETLAAVSQTACHLLALSGATPERTVADLHPGYLSTSWARELAAAHGVPLVQVQHHEAHAAALLTEHGLSLATEEPLLVACFDGTGYGRDGTLLGSEMLLVHNGAITRVAHLNAFPLPGGDAAVRAPWRTAIGVLASLASHAPPRWPTDSLPASAAVMAVVRQQVVRGLATATTSSMGRLFDAAASLTGLCHTVSFEAEAAMHLEAAAGKAGRDTPASAAYAFDLPRSSAIWPVVIGWSTLIHRICRDTAAGIPTATVALNFHAAVARLVVDVARLVQGQLPAGQRLQRVGLTGGVFQNRLLCEQAIARLRASGFEPLLPTRSPANDGSVAVGQAVLGRR